MAFILFVRAAAAILFFYVRSVLASPLSLTSRTVSAGDLSKFNLFEQYAAASYCPGNFNETGAGGTLSCPTGNCPLVSSANITTVYEFDHSLVTDVTGYIAVDKTRGLTVLAFRGSSSIRNFLADADFFQVPTDICDGCEAHQGFWDSWLEAREGILAALKTTADQNPQSQVVVTGHSLGGAIADIAAAEIRRMGVQAELYTFGAPRIAGRTLSDFITNQNAGGNFRITHFDDPVPMLPPLWLGYVHISPEYFIDKGNDVVPTVNDINELTVDINKLGNTGEPLSFNMAAHLWYFGKVSACNPNNGIQWK